MKKVTILFPIILSISINSCLPPEPGTQTHPKASIETYKTVEVIFLADRSRSFASHYDFPDVSLFKSLCTKISNAATLDFRYGCITNNSDITLDRYFVSFTQLTTHNANPWIISEKKKPTIQPSDWNEFATSVNSKLAITPSNGSDIASALGHAVVAFQEYGKPTRKILILCTDGADTYRQLPTVPTDIEVITVGVLPDNHMEQQLNTNNIKRFESLNSMLDFLNSQTF